jgi:IS1 family transposase
LRKRIKKKESQIEQVNKEYFETHKNIIIRIEMEEMWSFYSDKKHQIRLWQAVDHETGEAAAFWFGTREHKNLDKLLELLKPLKLGTVYTWQLCVLRALFIGGSDGYEEKHAKA